MAANRRCRQFCGIDFLLQPQDLKKMAKTTRADVESTCPLSEIDWLLQQIFSYLPLAYMHTLPVKRSEGERYWPFSVLHRPLT